MTNLLKSQRFIYFSVLLLSCSILATSADIFVDDDGVEYPAAAHTTIQDAVNAASSGDTIYVAPGSYTEQVTVDGKMLTIQGFDGTNVGANPGTYPSVNMPAAPVTLYTAASSKEYKIVIFAKNGGGLTLRYLTIDGMVQDFGEHYMGVFSLDTDLTVDYCTVQDFRDPDPVGNSAEDSGYGIVLFHTDNAADDFTVTNSTLRRNQLGGIWAYTRASATVVPGINISFMNNTISGFKDAMQVRNILVEIRGGMGTVSNNNFSDAAYVAGPAKYASAILCNTSDDLTVQQNTFTDCQVGFQYSQASQGTDYNYIFDENNLSISAGLKATLDGFSGFAAATIINIAGGGSFTTNTIDNYTYGFFNYLTSDQSYIENTVMNCSTAGFAMQNNLGATMQMNEIDSCGTGVLLISTGAVPPSATVRRIMRLKLDPGASHAGGNRAFRRLAPTTLGTGNYSGFETFEWNCIQNSTTAAMSITGGAAPFTADYTYWGAADGPSGDGPGSGDALSDPLSDVTVTNPLPACESGEVTITIDPAGAIAQGAMFSLDGGSNFYPSGTTLLLASGDYNVTTQDTAEWFGFVGQTVTVPVLSVDTATVNFFTTGQVRVILDPADQGLMWSYINGLQNYTSGTTINLPTGNYEFFAIGNGQYQAPASQEVLVTKGSFQTITFTYSGQEGGTGSLQVFLDDGEEDEGAWRFVTPNGNSSRLSAPVVSPWFASGYTATNVPIGPVTVEFRLASGFITPSPITVTVRKNSVTTTEVDYTRPLIGQSADFNGDGIDDLATFDPDTRTWHVASIDMSKRNLGEPKEFISTVFGGKNSVQVPGDYDGDGDADLAVYDPDKRNWNVRKQFILKNVGEENDIPVPGDYNGDGRAQPAFYRPDSGEWLIYDYESKAFDTYKFGNRNFVPMPANWDGDENGQTDLGIYNVESGVWKVATWSEKKQKYLGRGKYRLKSFGEKGDIPMVGDWDGDGTMNAALFRPSDNTWMFNGVIDDIQLGSGSDTPIFGDWNGTGRCIPTIFRSHNGLWFSSDQIIRLFYGKGEQPLGNTTVFVK